MKGTYCEYRDLRIRFPGDIRKYIFRTKRNTSVVWPMPPASTAQRLTSPRAQFGEQAAQVFIAMGRPVADLQRRVDVLAEHGPERHALQADALRVGGNDRDAHAGRDQADDDPVVPGLTGDSRPQPA